MTDEKYHRKMLVDFATLLDGLPDSWPKEDRDFILEEVGHGEYGDALENLIALGLQDGKGFGSVRPEAIQELARSMGLTDSALLSSLEALHDGVEDRS